MQGRTFMTSLRAAIGAFREAYFHAGNPDDLRSSGSQADTWSSYEARVMRYSLLWATYQNDQYSNEVHKWSHKYKADYGLYRNVRSIFGATYRITELYVTHVHGGILDPRGGDGEESTTSIPIVTGSESVRESLATLWSASNWQIQKDVWVRWGACLGDTFIQIEDDPDTQAVRICPVHPACIREVVKDHRGRITGYIREETRRDPGAKIGDGVTIGGSKTVVYTEVCEKIPGGVRYATYKDGVPYGWYGAPAEWTTDYPRVPLFHTQHVDSGSGWGISEVNAALVKVREADDIGSKVNDQIRKVVEAIWFFAGVQRSDMDAREDRKRTATEPTGQTDRERSIFLYAKDPSARVQAMVADLQVADVSEHITMMIDQLEKDYPEIRYDNLQLSGKASGNTLREARKPAESKIRGRRAAYDSAIQDACSLAIAIGTEKRYRGYSGIFYSDIENGNTQFQIGNRPVYEWGEYERLEEEQLFWSVAKMATDAGVPIEMFLEKHGWTAEDIAKVSQEREAAVARQALMLARTTNPFVRGNQ